MQTNLLDYTLNELNEIVVSLGESKFRGSQLYTAMLNGKNYDDKINLPKSFLDKLKEHDFALQPVKIYKSFASKDGTKKFLYQLNDNNLVEGVLMEYKFGYTLCVSTQVGCKMNCAFCASGLKFTRNLTVGEILGQIVAVNKLIGGTIKNRKITNIVLMGSGEPLDNFDNVVKFMKIVTSTETFNISVRNISVSTCGIPSKIEALADLGLAVTLCLSLHAPNDTIRKNIMPIAKRYNIQSVIEAAQYYHTMTNRRVIIEYTLIDGVNCSPRHAEALAMLLQGLTCHVNLINLNEVPERGLKGVDDKTRDIFLHTLIKHRVSATIRRSLGDDIGGACGQLRSKELKEKK